MAEITHASPEELKRREDYIRANQRERSLVDPFTWSYRWRATGATLLVSVLGIHFHNLYTQKPWYFALYPRLGGLLVIGAMGYGVGKLREHHNRTRDAVVDHYVKEHPSDFERLNDIYGRPYSNILTPWYPRRATYRKFD
ncbi:hypothetical protein M3Y98_00316500 [Aphelenchoides besseyi]|nr:hypothetical protein M3Y98_00316500 [Aphelenchoides besseyi]KAI6201369.1 hypothetical protein M3Y96_00834400 [Aphelenchoides besseyi]